MRKLIYALIVAIPLAVVAGVGIAKTGQGPICPLTGEELPCPNCCPIAR
jgi:hypothetical protein